MNKKVTKQDTLTAPPSNERLEVTLTGSFVLSRLSITILKIECERLLLSFMFVPPTCRSSWPFLMTARASSGVRTISSSESTKISFY